MTIGGGKSGRNLALILLLLAGVLSVGLEASGAMAVPQPFDNVQSRLIADGFDAERVRELYRQPEVAF